MYSGPARRRASGLVLAGLMLLSGCAQKLALPDREAAWHARSERMAGIDEWRLEARIGVVTADDGGTARMHWYQTPAGYDINLFGPFGRGLLKIHGTDTAATLKTPQGETIYAGDAETLIQQHLGWRVPVAPLRRWLLGLSAPEDTITLDGQGRLANLARDDWQVTFEAWQQAEGFELPQRLSVETEGLRIRLVVHSWRIL